MDDSAVPRNPPPKPKRSNVPTAPAEYPDDTYSDQDYNMSPIRRGRNHMNRQAESPPLTPTYGPRQAKVPIVDAEPETTIGAAVKMKGELSFERLLRIEGEFEGKLNSKGSLVIGTRGALIGNVDNMKEVYITGGRIVGNVNVEKLVLRDKAQVFGNITAKTVKIEPDCIIIGKMNVNPQAPERINDKGHDTP
ncbi:hypothetical protein BBO99_00007994 [Phytophthora kernoviae]|uniref:Polymer-forming cytoskeletal protein n=2 Tax=Phytophthora kernoviae TaxID=325452 RepID=A0A3R7MTU2_9STRA|nr:hypothetical protein G195_009138 [Phytophthora kernoviae 00238/432]KAG2516484.1 hypothetical protein JM16_007639 [Phytophthora kernoviae]KAG2519420.1 hypothetical protein JM18_007550 [Phytophthora kernoviae]RLN37297.1 hypothetical protein BBI17_007945 [Phytophthora kernoviae]RLN75868.1 hypothetical protein BBO99_00007994 [Phytophthora kernoviae]